MTLAMIRRDAALRGWPFWLLVLGVNSGVVMGILYAGARRGGEPISAPAFLLAAWLGVAIYLVAGPVRTRCSSLHLTLPLSSRRLWFVHAGAVSIGGLGIALAGVVTMLGQARLLGGVLAPGLDVPGLVAHLGAGVVLAVLLLQSPRPGLIRIPFTRGYALWAAAVLAAVPALTVVLNGMGAPWVLLTALLAAGVGYRASRVIPGSLSLIPLEGAVPRDGGARGETAGAQRPPAEAAAGESALEARPGRWILASALLRGVSAGPKEWMGIPFTLLFAALMGGGLAMMERNLEGLRFFYLPFMSYMLFSLVGPRLGRLHTLDPLPVSRRVLFAVLVLPYFALLCVGYAVGSLGAARVAARSDQVEYRETGSGYRVRVPRSICEIAWDGRVPAIVSPEGESRVPSPVPLWRGSRAVLYSPYDTPPGSSVDFVAFQLSRALGVVFGVSVSAREIAGRYLDTRADGLVVPAGNGVSFQRHIAGLTPRGHGPVFPIVMALVCVPWLLLTAMLLRSYRAGISDAARQRLMWTVVTVVLVLTLGALALVVAGFTGMWLFQVLVEIPARVIGASTPAIVATWILAAALVLGAYRVAQARFLRMEIPPRPTRYTLLDMMREEG
jgi:hypothetical protein